MKHAASYILSTAAKKACRFPNTTTPNIAAHSAAMNRQSRQIRAVSPLSKASPSDGTISRLSFAERKAALGRPSTPAARDRLIEGGHLMRDIVRAPPGDVMGRSTDASTNLGKQKSAYFEEAFASKDANPVQERIRCESIVVAEVRTNVIISDEFTFITELSCHLSMRYQRPVSSIVVNVQHGSCMLFGGTFEPAYVMSLFAVSTQIQPATNKRNAALITKHMEEALGVIPARGFLRFVPLEEDNMACNGKTLSAELSDLEKKSGSYLDEERQGITAQRTNSQRMVNVKSHTSAKATPADELTPPASASGRVPLRGLATAPMDGKPVSTKAARRTKSFVSTLLRRSGSKREDARPILKGRSGELVQ